MIDLEIVKQWKWGREKALHDWKAVTDAIDHNMVRILSLRLGHSFDGQAIMTCVKHTKYSHRGVEIPIDCLTWDDEGWATWAKEVEKLKREEDIENAEMRQANGELLLATIEAERAQLQKELAAWGEQLAKLKAGVE